jgi:hypothetical protein
LTFKSDKLEKLDLQKPQLTLDLLFIRLISA